jgi:hypothetical protein
MTGIRAARPLVGTALRPELPEASPAPVLLVRRSIGEVLRRERQHQGRTLREVSGAARVSLGYLSEVERGQKEASSELLAAICGALDLPLSFVLREVSDDLAVAEGRSPLRAHASAHVGGVVAAA